MYTEVSLPYGDSSLRVSLPTENIAAVLTAKHIQGLADERTALKNALCQPIESPPLGDCIHKNSRVIIITTDNTRACPDDKLVPILLEELTSKIPNKNITILVALGLHAPLTRDELIKKLGTGIVENYQVVNHDPAQTVFLGFTTFGTPVEVNSRVVEADFRISTGFIEPHFFAGFSGGRKSIAPGVSSARAIRHNHGYSMIGHPKARAGILDGNPVHEDMVEQARMAGLDFILNILMNESKQITHVLAGNPWSAHRMACDMEKEIVCSEIDRIVDITIVTNGGVPLDLDFYQTVKGIDTASKITRKGGAIIVASACYSGLGPLAFSSLHSALKSPEDILDQIKAGHQTGVAWQNQILANAQMGHTIYLYSRLKDNEVKSMKVIPIHSIEEGLNQAFRLIGSDAKIAVIPQGPMILPEIK